MLSARELVRKLKEGKEEEEKGDHEAVDQCDFGSKTSGCGWRAGTEENEGKKVQIQNQLDQDRYVSTVYFSNFINDDNVGLLCALQWLRVYCMRMAEFKCRGDMTTNIVNFKS